MLLISNKRAECWKRVRNLEWSGHFYWELCAAFQKNLSSGLESREGVTVDGGWCPVMSADQEQRLKV